MTDLEKDKILLLANSIGKMARELQSIKRLLKEIADASQTERIKTLDYCDICNHKGCDNCIANNLDDYCVPSGYEPITQTETQNSNLTFEKRTMLDCYNCKRFETEDECIECHYEPKTEPQTDKHKCRRCVYYDVSSDYYPCVSCVDYSNYTGEIEDEPQTEYERASEQREHDILYEPTYNPEDGSM